MTYRIEKDSLGEVKVPADAYYGAQTVRAIDNFPITGTTIHPEIIKGLGQVKIATSAANGKVKAIPKDVADAMVKASKEIAKGKFNDQFPIDPIQGGAGTSMNMCVNEVVSNRANEILGGKLGTYDLVHPNDHANFGQSTNDVMPTAGKIAVLNTGKKLTKSLTALAKAYRAKQKEFSTVIKMGRTHLQDAIPVTLGQEFGAFASAIERDNKRIKAALKEMQVLNMGATAIGTGLNADNKYMKIIHAEMTKATGIKMTAATDLIDGTRNLDPFLNMSATLRTLAMGLSKTSNDLRLMASGPKAGMAEINLPMMQPGSSIMPGKVNPVMPEVMNQVSFQVFGNDLVVLKACEAGQLELNVFEPVLFRNLLESIDILTNATTAFRQRCIEGITANEKACREYVERSAGVVTAFAPHLGYEVCSKLAKEAVKKNKKVKDLIIAKKLMTKSEVEKVMSPLQMTTPGIAKRK